MGILGIYVRTSVEKENTAIQQQKDAGIEFSEKKGFQYQIYEDVGKSGYKIEDENDIFKNRPGMSKLLRDIENKTIDKLWVWENSRLSRNEEASYALSRIFEKHKITLYEKDREFDLNSPMHKLIHGIFTLVSQYERHMIVARIQRGVDDSYNRGIRGLRKLYGYEKSGVNEDGYIVWSPVESEMEKIKYIYDKYIAGNSMTSIVKSLHEGISEKDYSFAVCKFSALLRKTFYTGYELKKEGKEIRKKFKEGETNNVQELLDMKFWVKSVSFPVEIVSIENWVKVVERLRENSQIFKHNLRQREESDIVTGLIECPYCGMKYFSKNNNGYLVYCHWSNKKCQQKPKSINILKVDNLFHLFFFYFYLVYDDTKILIEESQKLIKINQLEVKGKIKIIETENKKLDKQIERFQSVYESDSSDKELLKFTLVKEKELNNKKSINDTMLSKLKIEIDELNKKFEKDKLELTYYDVKNTVIGFFENLAKEEKRIALAKIIKVCQMFGNYITIHTGELLFIFNIKEENVLPDSVYELFKNDIAFKSNFLGSGSLFDESGEYTKDVQEFFDTPHEEKKQKYSELEIMRLTNKVLSWGVSRQLGDIVIREYYMAKERKVIESELKKLCIECNLENIKKVVSFTDDFFIRSVNT